MNSSLNSALLSTGTGTAAGRLVLPAAVDAPAALVIAVEMPYAQETSVLGQVLPLIDRTAVDAGTPFAGHTSARTRTAVTVPPPRGTPV